VSSCFQSWCESSAVRARGGFQTFGIPHLLVSAHIHHAYVGLAGCIHFDLQSPATRELRAAYADLPLNMT
jgi:hypothetical protein